MLKCSPADIAKLYQGLLTASVAELEPVEPVEPKLFGHLEPEPKNNNFGSATLPTLQLNSPMAKLAEKARFA